MTELTHTLDTVTGENAAIIDVAQDAVRAQQLDDGIYYDAVRGNLVDIRQQQREDADRIPGRKTGTYTVTDADSFVDYLAKHAVDATETWANVNRGTIRAVINAHGPSDQSVHELGDAGHQDHVATLQLANTDDWNEWIANDGKYLAQSTFAEFIEDHLPNFTTPSAADMLELAQTFQAKTKVDFQSSSRLSSGETKLQYIEDTSATAGKKGELAIPDTFEIRLQPFENGPAYLVNARFRYRISGGNLVLAYKLERPKDVRKGAFDKTVATVAEKSGRTIWATQ